MAKLLEIEKNKLIQKMLEKKKPINYFGSYTRNTDKMFAII